MLWFSFIVFFFLFSDCSYFFFFFFFNDTATTEIYTLSLHDALPISNSRLHLIDRSFALAALKRPLLTSEPRWNIPACRGPRSEEHTSELQSPCNLVCRLLLEKKKKRHTTHLSPTYKSSRRHTLSVTS